MTNPGSDGAMPHAGDEARFAALEAEIVALRAELAELRGRVRRIAPHEAPEPRERAAPSSGDSPTRYRDATTDARARPGPSLTDRLDATARPAMHRPSLSGDAVESWVGRYGTLIAAAFVILLGVGTLVVWAVQRGLL